MSTFFYKSQVELLTLKADMLTLLKIKGRTGRDIADYSKAYDYFMLYPNRFDGATIVKDLCDLPGLDCDAMLHDYEYIHGANRNFTLKWHSDWRYLKNCEKNGKGVRWGRWLALLIISPLYVPYNMLQNL